MSQNSTLLYTSGHTEWYIVQLLATVPMLVLLCTACWSVQGRVYRLRSAPSLEKGWSLSQRVLTHDETQHTAGEKETEQERERESESSHPSPPPPPPSSLLPPFPPCLPLTPHTPTRSGPRRHLWWAAASCWSRGRSSGRRARGPPRCGWPGPGAGPGAVGPSSRRRCASIRCIAAGRTLRRWRRTAAPGPGWSPRLSTATSAQRSAPRPGTVSERTSGGRERGREGEKRWRGKKKRVNINCIHAKQRSRGLWSEGKRGGGQRVMEPEEEWELSKHTRLTDNPLQQTSQTDDHEKKFSPENKSLCFPHTHTHTHTHNQRGPRALYENHPRENCSFFFPFSAARYSFIDKTPDVNPPENVHVQTDQRGSRKLALPVVPCWSSLPLHFNPKHKLSLTFSNRTKKKKKGNQITQTKRLGRKQFPLFKHLPAIVPYLSYYIMSDPATYRRPHNSLLKHTHSEKKKKHILNIILLTNHPKSWGEPESPSVPHTHTHTHYLYTHTHTLTKQVAKFALMEKNKRETTQQHFQSTGLPSAKLTESLSSSLSVCILCLPASMGRCSSINFMLSDRPLLHSTWLTDPRLCQWKIWLPGELDRLFEARRGTTWRDRNVVDDNALFFFFFFFFFPPSPPWHLVDPSIPICGREEW